MIVSTVFSDKTMLLTQMNLPKKLKTIHLPGKKIEIWMNNKKVENLTDYNGSELLFLKQFVSNLKEMGWIILLS